MYVFFSIVSIWYAIRFNCQFNITWYDILAWVFLFLWKIEMGKRTKLNSISLYITIFKIVLIAFTSFDKKKCWKWRMTVVKWQVRYITDKCIESLLDQCCRNIKRMVENKKKIVLKKKLNWKYCGHLNSFGNQNHSCFMHKMNDAMKWDFILSFFFILCSESMKGKLIFCVCMLSEYKHMIE